MSDIRYEVRTRKNDIKWEFPTWKEDKIQSLNEHLKKEYKEYIQRRQMELAFKEQLLNNVLYSRIMPIKKAAPKKSRVKKKPYQDPRQGDLPLF